MLLDPPSHALMGRDRGTWSPSHPSMAAGHVGGLGARPRLPGWLLIGSTGRNAGKTEFACEIIRAFRGAHPLIGVKVTAVADRESNCPRGGECCGACAALEGDFAIALCDTLPAARGPDPR